MINTSVTVIAVGSFLAGWCLRTVLAPCGALATRRVSSTENKNHSTTLEGGDVKLVIVVRQDLKMGKGKIAAQCGHAAVKAYYRTSEQCPELLDRWLRNGQPKVVLKVTDDLELRKLQQEAGKVGLGCHTIHDAGHTQVTPGSLTVAAIGPGPAELVNQVTGHLKLM